MTNMHGNATPKAGFWWVIPDDAFCVEMPMSTHSSNNTYVTEYSLQCTNVFHRIHSLTDICPSQFAASHIIRTRSEILFYYAEKYDSNINAGTDIMFYGVFVTCGKCNQVISIDFSNEGQRKNSYGIFSFSEWAKQPFRLTSPEYRDSFILHNNLSIHSICCNRCGHHADIYPGPADIYVEAGAKETIITMYVGIGRKGCERIVLNHQSGKSYFASLHSNHLKYCRDISDHCYIPTESGIELCINSSLNVKNSVWRRLVKPYGNLVQISNVELTLKKMIILNRYQGFPRAFIEAVEYTIHNTPHLDNISPTTAKYTIDRYYKKMQNSMLGRKGRHQRKILLENLPLLFFEPELIDLPFRNQDIFQNILKSDGVSLLLAQIRACPYIVDFLQQLIGKKGEAGAWNTIKNHLGILMNTTGLYESVGNKKMLTGCLPKIETRLYHKIDVNLD